MQVTAYQPPEIDLNGSRKYTSSGELDMDMKVLGSCILLEEFSETAFGKIFKAIPLKGDPKIFLVHTLNEEIRKDPQTATVVKACFEKWKRIKDINTLNLTDWQEKDGQLFYAFEYERGRLLSNLLAECARECLPLAFDQAVYLASRILEGLLSVKNEDFFYGNLTTEQIFVTFEGEVRLLPGAFRDLHSTPLKHSTTVERFTRSYPPDLREGRPVKPRDQVYFLGLIMFEFLCRETFEVPGQPFDPKARLDEARKGIGMGEGLPANLMRILDRSLNPASEGAYRDLESMKADLDELVNSGEYSPSTFNTAFLIHTLYRDQDEKEAEKDEQFLKIERKPFEPKPEKKLPRPPAQPPPAEPESPPSTFGLETETEPESRKRLFIGIGAVAAVIVIAVIGWLIFSGGADKEKEQKAREEETQKMKALEEQNRQLKEQLDRLQSETRQKEEQVAQAKTPEEKAAAQKALDEAKKKLDEAQKVVQDVKKPAAPEAKPAVTAPSPALVQPAGANSQPGEKAEEPEKKPEPQPEAQPASPEQPSQQAVKQGDFVDYVSLDVRPQQVNKVEPDYPPLARQNKVEGRVYVKVEIDENGGVTSAEVVRGPNPDHGLFDSCVAAAKKTKFSPGMKNNLRVKTNYTLNYAFTLKK